MPSTPPFDQHRPHSSRTSRRTASPGRRRANATVAGLLPGLLIIVLTTPAWAQRDAILKEVPDTQIRNLTPVVATETRLLSVSDASGLLAVGHKPQHMGPNISLWKLDAQGVPTDAPPVGITLPRPASLSAHANHPLGMAFHPVFPLLYVWQEIDGSKRDEPGDQERYKEFDHLLVYDVEPAEPRLLESYARGPDFSYGNIIGRMVLNAEGTRLYVPNITHAPATGTATVCGVGCFHIDPDGLPVMPDPEGAEATPPSGSKAARPDPATAAANRAAKLAVLQAARAAGQTINPRLISTAPSDIFSNLPPLGLGFAPVDDDTVIFGGYAGPVTWDDGDRRARLMSFYTEPYVPLRQYIVGHPRLPVIFSTSMEYPFLYRMEHADGHITLMPQQWTIEGAVAHSVPVVMAPRSQVAFGGVNKVYVIGLDPDGFLKKERIQAAVDNPTVAALGYSEKYDRLYVTIEKPK